MKVELIVENDEEMRKYLKDMIRNQVVSVAKEEMEKLIAEILARRLENKYNITNVLDDTIKALCKQYVNNAIYSTGNPIYIEANIKTMLKEEIQKQVSEALKKI